MINIFIQLIFHLVRSEVCGVTRRIDGRQKIPLKCPPRDLQKVYSHLHWHCLIDVSQMQMINQEVGYTQDSWSQFMCCDENVEGKTLWDGSKGMNCKNQNRNFVINIIELRLIIYVETLNLNITRYSTTNKNVTQFK